MALPADRICWARRVGAIGGLILIATWGSVALAMGPSGDTAAGSKRALLIGINDYASPLVPNLRGAVNDIQLMARILETRFGFESDGIRLLTDADATRSAILAALDELVEAAQPEDTVYVHFSGHGSQVEDLRGDEEDGLDETILPHDARTDGIADIVDDELDLRFDRLRARTVFMVFDSCHSGTVTRSATLGGLTRRYADAGDPVTSVIVRAVPPDRRLGLYAPEALGTLATRSVVPVERLNHVLMTSAPAEHEAFDGPIGDGWFGLFSYSLARSMESLGPQASAMELHDRARAELQDVQARLNVLAPIPQLEGPAVRLEAPPLGMPTTAGIAGQAPQMPDRSWVPATRLADDRMLLAGGAPLGAQPGSQWALYGNQDNQFQFGRALGSGTVQSVQGDDAVLIVQHRTAALPDRARAVRLTSAEAWAEVPVRVLTAPGTTPAGRIEALIASVRQAVPEITLARSGEYARFLIELAEGTWTIRDAGGLTTLIEFADGDDVVVAQTIQHTLANASSALALLALDNPASAIDLRVAIIDATLAADAGLPVRGVVIRPSESQPIYRFRREGEARSAANSLMLEIASDRAGYLTIVHVDPTGSSALLFPNDYQNPDFLPQGYVAGGSRVRIPDGFGDDNRAGFHWDYGPPEGRDTLRVFFAEDLATAQAIRNSVAVATRSALTPIRQLNQTLTGQRLRGVVMRPGRVDGGSPALELAAAPERQDWTARTVVIDVRP